MLGIRAARVPHYPPETCVAEHCSVNFNFDLVETAGWFNLPTIPQGFGWSDFDPDVDESADEDDRRFVFQGECRFESPFESPYSNTQLPRNY